MFYKHLRKVREMEEGAELKAELHKLTLWIDEDPKLFTGDIIYSILLTYRDIQVRLLNQRLYVYVCSLCVCKLLCVVCGWMGVYTSFSPSLPPSLTPSLPPSLPHRTTIQ